MTTFRPTNPTNKVRSIHLNRRLLLTLGANWMALLLCGGLIAWQFAAPSVAILIDRSYCHPEQWQQVAQQYAALYQQQQRQDLQIRQVVLFSHLGEEVRSQPPQPEEIQQLRTYGQADATKQQTLASRYAPVKLLSCQP